jgi:hypothetical protein
MMANWPGLQHANMINTAERTYCIIAEWSDMDALVNAREQMIATLNSFRNTLKDLGGGLGVTDPVSGRWWWRSNRSRPRASRALKNSERACGSKI